jgi:hypothetical protein
MVNPDQALVFTLDKDASSILSRHRLPTAVAVYPTTRRA